MTDTIWSIKIEEQAALKILIFLHRLSMSGTLSEYRKGELGKSIDVLLEAFDKLIEFKKEEE